MSLIDRLVWGHAKRVQSNGYRRRMYCAPAETADTASTAAAPHNSGRPVVVKVV